MNSNKHFEAGAHGPYVHDPPQAGYPSAYNQGFPADQPPQYEQPQPQFGQPQPQFGKPQAQFGQPQPQIHLHNTQTQFQQPQPTNVTIISQPGAPPPRDRLGCAIFACLCCFWPTGLAAIIVNSSAKDAWRRGDYVGAEQKASTARTLIIVSIVLGIALYVSMNVLRVLGYVASSSSASSSD